MKLRSKQERRKQSVDDSNGEETLQEREHCAGHGEDEERKAETGRLCAGDGVRRVTKKTQEK